MHFRGFVFDSDPAHLMRSLIQVEGEPPAEVWLPLVVREESARSGWAWGGSDDGEGGSAGADEERLHCAWPTRFLRERLGPYALLGDRALDSTGVHHRNVKRIEGQWSAAVPRFFRTIGDHWSLLSSHELTALAATNGQLASTLTVADLDLGASQELASPSLVVGPDGPVFYEWPWRRENRRTYRARLLAATAPLLDLPPDTPVWIVDWHG